MDTVKHEPLSPGFEDDVSLSPSSPKLEEVDDDDNYEDSMDLDLSKSDKKMWLVRLPRFLMDKWKDVDKISGQELGKVRIKTTQDGRAPWKVKLVLNDNEQTKDIPHEYDISLVKQVVENTYVFSEQDFPQHVKKKQQVAAAQHRNALKAPSAGSDELKNAAQFQPYVRTVPKKTALVGRACHECLVTPSFEDKNYNKVVSQRRAMDENASRAKVTLLDNIPGMNATSFGTVGLKTNLFMRAQQRNAKTSEGKATRIPKNELLDMLFRLFELYDYWTMKGLRERTKQPESYLKEVLDTMAVLIKKGPYAMKYSLKPEFKQVKGQLSSGLSDYIEKSGNQLGIGTSIPDSAGSMASALEQASRPADDDNDEDVDMETIL
jgi:transcription initiation factor TFIIF subunit beta